MPNRLVHIESLDSFQIALVGSKPMDPLGNVCGDSVPFDRLLHAADLSKAVVRMPGGFLQTSKESVFKRWRLLVSLSKAGSRLVPRRTNRQGCRLSNCWAALLVTDV